MSKIPSWAVEYVGIPFVLGGADSTGADCYGLVSMILTSQTGSPLPETPDQAKSEGWYVVPMSDVRRGDVILFKLPGGATHVAFMITDEHFIETKPGSSSAVRRVTYFSGRTTAWRRI